MSKEITIPAIGFDPIVFNINETRYEYRVGHTYEVPDEVAQLIDNIVGDVSCETRGEKTQVLNPVSKTAEMTSPVGVDADGKLYSIEKDSEYRLSAATTGRIGGVKKATAVTDIATDAELSAVISSVNGLLSALRTAGIVSSS